MTRPAAKTTDRSMRHRLSRSLAAACGIGLAALSMGAATAGAATTLRSTDPGFSSDRLVFNRIDKQPNADCRAAHPLDWPDYCEDRSKKYGLPDDYADDTRKHGVALLQNTGSSDVTVTALSVSSLFSIDADALAALPATLQPGGQLQIGVNFNATLGTVGASGSGCVPYIDPYAVTRTAICSGSLSATSDGVVQKLTLKGWWSYGPEGARYEPTLAQTVNSLLGYQTLVPGYANINTHGHVEAYSKNGVQDEVISPYWQRADPAQPVKVTQLAAFHTQGDPEYLRFVPRGADPKNEASGTKPVVIANHSGRDSQSFFPHMSPPGQDPKTTDTGNPFVTTFEPPVEWMFGSRKEWTDSALNDHTPDLQPDKNGKVCEEPCGFHMRAWKLRLANGSYVPNAYIIAMDYAGLNYDYNDNVWIVENIEPYTAPSAVISRIDVGYTGSGYTDSLGRRWSSDAGLFSPGNAVAEKAPNPVFNTRDDSLYQTYRGQVAGGAPLKFHIPIPSGVGSVDLRLFFSERGWTAANQRLFDIEAEGRTIASDYDIFAASGGKSMAWSKAWDGIGISDGALDLSFAASKDFPSVSAIEIVCQTGCSDVVPTPTPGPVETPNPTPPPSGGGPVLTPTPTPVATPPAGGGPGYPNLTPEAETSVPLPTPTPVATPVPTPVPTPAPTVPVVPAGQRVFFGTVPKLGSSRTFKLSCRLPVAPPKGSKCRVRVTLGKQANGRELLVKRLTFNGQSAKTTLTIASKDWSKVRQSGITTQIQYIGADGKTPVSSASVFAKRK